MTTVSVGNSKLVLNDAKLTIEGNLSAMNQLEPLKDALSEAARNLNNQSQIAINVSKCEDCISLLLNPVLSTCHELVKGKSKVTLYVATEDGEFLPWHETLVGFVQHVTKGTPTVVQVEAQELS